MLRGVVILGQYVPGCPGSSPSQADVQRLPSREWPLLPWFAQGEDGKGGGSGGGFSEKVLEPSGRGSSGPGCGGVPGRGRRSWGPPSGPSKNQAASQSSVVGSELGRETFPEAVGMVGVVSTVVTTTAGGSCSPNTTSCAQPPERAVPTTVAAGPHRRERLPAKPGRGPISNIHGELYSLRESWASPGEKLRQFGE